MHTGDTSTLFLEADWPHAALRHVSVLSVCQVTELTFHMSAFRLNLLDADQTDRSFKPLNIVATFKTQNSDVSTIPSYVKRLSEIRWLIPNQLLVGSIISKSTVCLFLKVWRAACL